METLRNLLEEPTCDNFTTRVKYVVVVISTLVIMSIILQINQANVVLLTLLYMSLIITTLYGLSIVFRAPVLACPK